MSIPGWYPDPAGAQGRFRFWDGQAWSSVTTTNPADPAPGGDRDRSSGGGGRWWMIVAAVVGVLLLALVAWLIFGNRGGGPGGGGFGPGVPEDTNSAEPTVSGWDETSKPTPPPSQASMITCPFTDVDDETPQTDPGRLRGGGISVAKINGWDDYNMYLDWASDIHTQMDTVRPGWISNIGVAQLNTVDGFTSMQVGARQTMECFSTSGYYNHFTNRVDIKNEQVTIDGHPAWWFRAEVRIDGDLAGMPEIEGDLVDVIVIDLGDPDRMGMFFSSVTIGDTARQEKVDAAIASITVG